MKLNFEVRTGMQSKRLGQNKAFHARRKQSLFPPYHQHSAGGCSKLSLRGRRAFLLYYKRCHSCPTYPHISWTLREVMLGVLSVNSSPDRVDETLTGLPASGIKVKIFRAAGALTASDAEDEDIYQWESHSITETVTNADGRGQLVFDITPGSYKVVFYVAPYFERTGTPTFYTKVDIMFRVADPASHYHVPLILSPYGYSTYRGS